MSEFAIQMRKISKKYDGTFANQEIDFALKKGTIHAIAGENGAGKSTLMKILFGLERPDADCAAEISVNGQNVAFSSPIDAIKSGIGMVQQHFALSEVLTPVENIVLGAEPTRYGILDRASAEAELRRLAQQELQVPWTAETGAISIGEHQRIEILKLLFRKSETLILDEPTGVLTPSEVLRFFELLKRLRQEGKSIVLITHKLDEIFNLCDGVTVLRQGKVSGNFKISDISKNDLIEAMIGRNLKPKPQKQKKSLSGDPIFTAEDLCLEKVGRGSIQNLNFNIKSGEVLGIAGIEGNGQQALVEALFGWDNSTGKITYKNQILDPQKDDLRRKYNFALISEDRHRQSLWLEESIATNCTLGMEGQVSNWGIVSRRKSESFANTCISPYGLKYQNLKQKVKDLSGGNQQKVVIAREITGRKSDFLVICQPTRGVDIGAIESIHEAILEKANQGAAILLISSELEELTTLSDRILVINQGKFVYSTTGPDFDLSTIGEAMVGKVAS